MDQAYRAPFFSLDCGISSSASATPRWIGSSATPVASIPTSHGLGRPAGFAGAFIALVTYHAIAVAVYGLFGFFANDIVKTVGGPDLRWLVYSTVLAAVVFRCGIRNIKFSGTG
jgi:hypothetical protein